MCVGLVSSRTIIGPQFHDLDVIPQGGRTVGVRGVNPQGKVIERSSPWKMVKLATLGSGTRHLEDGMCAIKRLIWLPSFIWK